MLLDEAIDGVSVWKGIGEEDLAQSGRVRGLTASYCRCQLEECAGRNGTSYIYDLVLLEHRVVSRLAELLREGPEQRLNQRLIVESFIERESES